MTKLFELYYYDNLVLYLVAKDKVTIITITITVTITITATVTITVTVQNNYMVKMQKCKIW